MPQALLTLQDLSCARGGRWLFDGLNLELRAGQCVEVQGANGSGKSTLLRVVAGLFPDYRGCVEAVPAFFMGHRPAVSSLLSPRENLEWYERLIDNRSEGARRKSRPTVAQALHGVGLAMCSEEPCGRLSQGQQRRVGLAMALINNESLWLLDEPLSTLDEQGQALVAQLVTEHCAAGGGALCATHQPLGLAQAQVVNLAPVA